MASPKKSTRSKRTRDELTGQSDPRAALDSAAFLAAVKPLLARLEDDLKARATASPAVTAALTARYEAEKQAQRTADSFAGWIAALATQVAAAWLLSCVFVRTLEDRGLLKQARLAGPGAEDSQKQFFQLAPSLTERDYLLTVFSELARHPAAAALFDAEHSLVWKLSPSAEVAKELLALFRAPSAIEPAFRFGQPSTRFLGDLYQDISEDVRKRYALLQTPDFVEAYILDRTLEPAITRFGLDDTTLIDPTCGSGHFLLGAFDRLFEHRLRAEPGIDARIAATKALDCVYGADINPYAVAIARFRLTLAFLDKTGYSKLADAPALPLHLVCADSLRINPQHPQQELWQHAGAGAAGSWLGEVFAFDDERTAKDVLGREYAAVVGNPPYITVKDKALRDTYRVMYPRTASREYSLAAPFCERIFMLARRRGYTGQITANSFMKREFGRLLIEEYLPTVNLEGIVNTSGAYVPGHGTPTVILFGTNESAQGSDLRVVLAKRGEPSTPDNPSQGLVWRSIVDHGDTTGFENDFVSTVRVARSSLAKHPWSLGGGGALELKETLEARAVQRLADVVELIGFGAVTREDDVFVMPVGAAERWRLGSEVVLPYAFGETIRDWSLSHEADIAFPYTEQGTVRPDQLGHWYRLAWCYRTQLWSRQGKGFKTKKEAGGEFYEYSMFYPERHFAPLRIAFAFVATHNHFVLDRGGKVFNRTAPIIKLPDGATEDDHLALLAYLNSSTACFWLKQVSFDKGAYSGTGKQQDDPAKIAYEFTGTQLEALPIPELSDRIRVQLAQLAREASELGERRARALEQRLSPTTVRLQGSLRMCLETARRDDVDVLGRLVALQEEIDWTVYRAFGLCDVVDSMRAGSRSDVGARPFEVSAARNGHALGLDGQRLIAAPLPTSDVLEARVKAISDSSTLRLLESEAHKRRWVVTPRDLGGDVLTFEQRASAVLLRGLEEEVERIVSNKELNVVTGSVVRSELLSTASFVEALEYVFREKGNGSTEDMIETLLESVSIPFLSQYIYSATGIAKHQQWLSCWEAQRREDLGQPAAGLDPKGPRYLPVDYATHTAWTNRGKLGVPKERLIYYPFCQSDSDGEPVYGWAGWDHLQRAQVLSALYLKRKDSEGWTAARLMPMLAGLLELLPWVKQWHNEPSAEFNGLRMGDYFAQFLDGECRLHGVTHEDLRAWRPEKSSRGKLRAATAPNEEQIANGAGTDAPLKARKPRAKKQQPATAVEPSAETEAE